MALPLRRRPSTKRAGMSGSAGAFRRACSDPQSTALRNAPGGSSDGQSTRRWPISSERFTAYSRWLYRPSRSSARSRAEVRMAPFAVVAVVAAISIRDIRRVPELRCKRQTASSGQLAYCQHLSDALGLCVDKAQWLVRRRRMGPGVFSASLCSHRRHGRAPMSRGHCADTDSSYLTSKQCRPRWVLTPAEAQV